MKIPKPSEITALRKAAKLTQKESAKLVHTNIRTFQQWEAGDRDMRASCWEMYRIKVAFTIVGVHILESYIALTDGMIG